MQDEVNTKVVAIMIKGGKISAEVLKKALDKFVQEIEKAQKQMQQPQLAPDRQRIQLLYLEWKDPVDGFLPDHLRLG